MANFTATEVVAHQKNLRKVLRAMSFDSSDDYEEFASVQNTLMEISFMLTVLFQDGEYTLEQMTEDESDKIIRDDAIAHGDLSLEHKDQ